MTELITVDEIATLIGGTLSGDDEDVLQMYLDFAVGEVEAYLGRPIEVREFEEHVIPDYSGQIHLSQTPVVSIQEIEIDGVVSERHLYEISPWGVDFVASYGVLYGGFDYDLSEIIVRYTAGLDTPQAVNSVIANGVVRQWTERVNAAAKSAAGAAGLAELRVEDYAIKYHDQTGVNMYAVGANSITIFRHESDFNPIKRFKRRNFA